MRTFLYLVLMAASSLTSAQTFQQVSTLPYGGGPGKLDFLSPQLGYAIQSYYAVKTTNGGQTWSTISQEQFGGAYTYTAMWVVDSNRIYLGKNSGGRLRYTTNGSTWTDLQLGVNQAIRSIHFIDSLHGFMLLSGNSGSVSTVTFMKTVDAGATWTSNYVFPVNGYDAQVRFFSPTHGLAWYQEQVYHTFDGGTTWASSGTFTLDIFQLSMLTPAQGIIAGQTGFVAYTTDSGRTFTPILSNFSRQISDVQILSPSEALGITWSGSNSQLRHTADTGRTWTILAEGTFIRRMDRDASGEFWFYGTNNNIFKTTITTGQNELDKLDIRVWPNPASDHINVHSPTPILNGGLFDALGNQVLKIDALEVGQHTIPLSSVLQSGLYFLRLEGPNGVATKKIVLNGAH